MEQLLHRDVASAQAPVACMSRLIPVLAQPNATALAPMSDHGVRYIVASDGLWREVNTPWLSALLPVAQNPQAMVPFGQCQAHVTLRCSAPSKMLWAKFVKEARARLPNECAAAMLWSPSTDTWRLQMRRDLEASAAAVSYQEVSLQGDEILVVDVHSHGTLPAFFSEQDDRDDHGSIKVAAVFGRCDSGTDIEMSLRLCILDTVIDNLGIEADGSWGMPT